MILFVVRGISRKFSNVHVESLHCGWDDAVHELYERWDGRNPWEWYICHTESEARYYVHGTAIRKLYDVAQASDYSFEWYHEYMEDHREKIAKFNDRFNGHDWMKEGF